MLINCTYVFIYCHFKLKIYLLIENLSINYIICNIFVAKKWGMVIHWLYSGIMYIFIIYYLLLHTFIYLNNIASIFCKQLELHCMHCRLNMLDMLDKLHMEMQQQVEEHGHCKLIQEEQQQMYCNYEQLFGYLLMWQLVLVPMELRPKVQHNQLMQRLLIQQK